MSFYLIQERRATAATVAAAQTNQTVSITSATITSLQKQAQSLRAITSATVDAVLKQAQSIRAISSATSMTLTPTFQSGAFTPASISGLMVWVDFSNASTLTLSGANITAYTDVRGAGTNTFSPSRTGYAQHIASGQNGLATASIAWSDLVGYSNGTSLTATNSFTCAAVLKFASPKGANFNAVMPFTEDVSGGATVTMGTGSHIANYWGYDTTGFTADVTNYHSCICDVSGGSSGVAPTIHDWLDGSSVTTSPTATLGGNNPTHFVSMFGGTFYLSDGYIAEICLYNSVLSATDRGNLQTYLKNKWGTP